MKQKTERNKNVRYIGLILTIVGLIALNSIFFFAHDDRLDYFTGSFDQKMMAWGMIGFSIAVIALTSWMVAGEKSVKISLEQYSGQKTLPDYQGLIKHMPDKCFETQKEDLNSCIQTFLKKETQCEQLIVEQFGTSLTASKYLETLAGVETRFYLLVEQIIKRMEIFDYKDYTRMKKERDQASLAPYQSLKNEIDTRLNELDSIIILLDQLQLELLKVEEADRLPAMEEMNRLVADTHLYQ